MKTGKPGSGVSFGAVPNGPLTEEDARDIVGPALLALAEKHKGADVRSLSKRLVYNEVKAAGKTHPLWAFIFHCSEKQAAEAYFLERCHTIIKSVEIIKVTIGTLHRERAFVPASEVLQRSPSGGYLRKPAHVLREDALRKDPEYQSVLGGAMRRFIVAFEWLEDWTSKRQQTPETTEVIATGGRGVDAEQKSGRRG